MPKLIKNQCQNRYRKRLQKSRKFMFFWKGKTLILSAEHCSVVQKQASRGFVRGECANGKLFKKTSKMRPTSIRKSIKNLYKFHARKSDAKNIEKHKKWNRKGCQNEEKTYQNRYEKKLKKRSPPRCSRDQSGIWHRRH
jgi:hypothetical protein